MHIKIKHSATEKNEKVSAEIISLLSDVIIMAGPAGAAIAFLVGLRQYKKGQNWMKARFMLSLIESFEKNKEINLACRMLDWDKRDIVFSDGKAVNFSNDILVSALRIVRMDIESPGQSVVEGEPPFISDECRIRDAFDTFFDFFDRLYALEKSGLLPYSDMWYFYYWFALLSNIGEHKKDPRIQNAFDEYINAYNFVGIRKLLEKFQKDHKAKEEYKIRYDLIKNKELVR